MSTKRDARATIDSARIFIQAGGLDAGSVWLKKQDGRLRRATAEEITLACDTIPKFRATRHVARRIAA